ncbi:zinc finger protein 729 [Calliphora vicina]|uniref:zinc finger protein 729 n=1 Tax=Calliphora vicina TaxID=7373 RepID=UPI00325C1E8A
MMLSVENLRQYCRTCLIKLEITIEDHTTKAIPTSKCPDLERLIEVCLARTTAGDDSLCYYAPFLCRSCFDKWMDFLKLYQLAITADEKIRNVLEKEVLKTENKDEGNFKKNTQNENFNEYLIDAEALVDIHEVEKYETESPFYTNSHSNTPINDIQYKATHIDDGTQLNRELETEEIEIPISKDYDDDCVHSSSDNADDIDFTPKKPLNQKRIKIKNSQKNKKTRKSSCILKKTYKTRKSLLKCNKNQIRPEIQNEYTTDIGDNDNAAKKVRYQCEPCNQYFWEKNKYDGHVKQVHEGIRRPYQCLQCDKAYNLYKTLLQHKRECHSEKSKEIFKCDKCDKIFKTAVILKQHLTNKHSEQKEAMRSICDQCGFIAAHQYSLSRHIINKHTETDQIKCDHCPKVFKTQYSLKYHVIGNHNPSNIKPFKCPECQMGFTRKTLLNQHKRTHIKYTERIKCDFEGCEVRFVKHGDKTHHMRLVHLKVKQHICDFCGEAFGAMQTLRHHRFIHTGEKPYKCNVCGQGFRQRTAMKTHRKIHFGKDTERQDLINNLPEINLSLVNTLNTNNSNFLRKFYKNLITECKLVVMITLTKNNAKERCRTCLCKLLKDEDNDENVVTYFSNKFVDINTNKQLQEMLEKYVYTEGGVDLCNDQSYPQYVCLECLKHLQTFETFQNKAMDSAKKLYKVFSGNCMVPKIELNDDGLECKDNKVEQISDCVKDDIFNLFLKDSLMETEAIILDDTDNNNDFNNMDPDPFQNTQKPENIRKPRTRRAKGKSDSLPNSKSNYRKSKKSNMTVENESINKKLETITALQTKNKTDKWAAEQGDSDENFDWQESSFQDPGDDSSDNEVLSNKIPHSEIADKVRKQKPRKCNVKLNEENSFSNREFRVESQETEKQSKDDLKENNSTSSTSRNSIELEKQPLEIIKTELDSDGEASSDSEFNTQANILSKPAKIEKKKRHYILNSGRKKGLANRYKCDQCQHKFGHKLTLEAHVRKVHEGQKKAFRCQLCDKAYSFVGGLSTHIRDVHERKQDSYDCSVSGCDKKYSNFITLQRHVRFKHLNMESTHQYVCEQCGATFKQSSNLRYHMKTRHPTEEDLKRKELLPKDRLECEECKKSFHSQYTLKYHKLRVHADEKKFECKICGRRVAKQFMLDSHMLVHSDQKLACKFCGREFVRKYQVEAHIRAVHQKLKPFQCPHCSESFASRKTLRHHIYIHTGEKPYVCDICGQAYRQPTCLKNHRKIHNKLSANDAATAIAANRSFINNFVQNNDALTNGEENLVLN